MPNQPRSTADRPLAIHIIIQRFNAGKPMYLQCPGHFGLITEIAICAPMTANARIEVRYESEFASGSVQIRYDSADEKVNFGKHPSGALRVILPE